MASLTINGFNVGTDLNFTVSDDYGDVFSDSDFGRVIEFSLRADDKVLKVTPIDKGGVPTFQTIPSGFSGQIRLVRYGPTFDQMMAEREAAYYGYGLMPQFAITVLVRNRDASMDEFLLSGVQFHRGSFLRANAEREMDEGIEFNASQMIPVGSISAVLGALAGAAL